MNPLVEFLLPSRLLTGDVRRALLLAPITSKLLTIKTLQQVTCCRPSVAANSNRYFLYEPQHLVIGIDLYDLRVLRPVIHPMLGQGTKWPEPGTEGQYHVSPRNQLHPGLGALVTEGSAPQGVAGGE